MGDVIRLPKQHRGKPHCPACQGPMPNLNDLHMSIGREGLMKCVLKTITFRVVCPCGAEWDMEKRVTT